MTAQNNVAATPENISNSNASPVNADLSKNSDNNAYLSRGSGSDPSTTNNSANTQLNPTTQQANPANSAAKPIDSKKNIIKKKVIIFMHGTSTNPSNYVGLTNALKRGGFEVFAPADSDPFSGNAIVSLYNSLKAQNNASLDLEHIILVGHSAGAAGVETAAAKIGKSVAGVICIDGVSTTSYNNYAKYAYFRHSNDSHGNMVGNVSPKIKKENVIIQKTLPGLHITCMSGSDASNYIDAANQILN